MDVSIAGDRGGPAAGGERELTARALVAGALVGLLLAVVNVYMGLKTGWWDSGSITASILGFALLSFAARRSGVPPDARETNVVQTLAASVGAMPAAAGLLGPLPALALMRREPPGWLIGALGLALGALGVAIALALRKRLLEEEDLPFPTGIATAEVIGALHAGGSERRGRTLLGSAAAALAATWLRDGRPALLPGAFFWPGTVGGLPAASLGLGIAASPMMIGAGMLVGVQNGLSVLLGAVLAWALAAPVLVGRGLVAGASYTALAAWLMWPAVGLMLGAAAVALAGQAGTVAASLRDLGAARRGAGGADAGRRDRHRLLLLAGLAAVAVLWLGWRGFGLHPLVGALALALSLPLASVCARAAGRTDFSPVGDMGQLTQAVVGTLTVAGPAATIAAGAIVSGEAAQTGVSLWSLRAGSRLGASPRRQARAMLLGVAVGSLAAIPSYLLLSRAYGIGTAAFPAPVAARFKALAEVLAGGAAAMPEGAGWVAAAAFALGVLLEAGGRTRMARWLPSAGAMGVGVIAPAHYAFAICLGALLAAAWRKARPGPAGVHAAPAGAGLIAGESVMGLLVALLVAAGVMPAP